MNSVTKVNTAPQDRMAVIAGETASDHDVGIGDAKARTRFILGKITAPSKPSVVR